MTYRLRFVQHFKEPNRKEFLELEKKFIELEQTIKEFPKGKRFMPLTGRDPGNTLIWECDLSSFEEVQKALDFLEQDTRHTDLHDAQLPYFVDCYTEIYRSFE